MMQQINENNNTTQNAKSRTFQRVLAMHDLSGLGRSSLMAITPVLSVMGKLFMTVTGIWTDCSIDFLSNSIIALVIIGVFVLFILFCCHLVSKSIIRIKIIIKFAI